MKTHLPRLRHMFESIQHIEVLTAEQDHCALEDDRKSRMALEREFEIISEASRHLPDSLKERWPGIPWRSIAGIGNVLRHDYEEVALFVLLDAAREDMPLLKRACEKEIELEQRRISLRPAARSPSRLRAKATGPGDR